MEYMKKKNIGMTPSIRKKSYDVIEKAVSNIKFKGRKVVFVGISGGMASGKTKISQYFHKYIERSATICELSFFSPNEKNRIVDKTDEEIIEDYDKYNRNRRLFLIDICNPSSYDYDKFYETLKNLSEGKKVRIPYFDDEQCIFVPEKDNYIDPSKTPLIIIDGYFILYFRNGIYEKKEYWDDSINT